MSEGDEFEKFDKVTVLGPGMIGASFSRALKKRGLATHVTGCSRSKDILESSVSSGYIDSYDTDPVAACSDADLILLATPVESFKPLVTKIAPALKAGAIVIDAGSVKSRVISDIEGLFPETVSFVPCHPIAGNERSGPDASEPELFQGACCIITPTENTNQDALIRVKSLWVALGAFIEELDPAYHDKVYALVSHFPHLVMFTLVNVVSDMDDSALRFTGAGFDDSTRIAKSSPALWRNICMMNKSNLIECIDTMVAGLTQVKSALITEDADALEVFFKRAQTKRLAIKGGR
jgi:prephenate dehydrogenase